MNDDPTLRRDPTPEEAANIADRYRRGQTLQFIRFATGFGRPAVVRTLEAQGVKLRRPGRHASGNWGYTGGLDR